MAKKRDKKMIELENKESESDFSALSAGVNIGEPYPKKISDIFRDYKDGKVILQPEFQRDFVWPSKKQAELIRSLWRGIPLPMFYFSVNNNQWEVIDGQQRLTTIFGYIEPSSIDKKIRKRIVKKVKINDGNGNIQSEQVIEKILNDTKSKIYCVEIPDVDLNPNDKFEIFRALNQGATILKAQEIRNAIFQREIPCLNNVLRKNAKKLGKLLNMRNERMNLEEFVLRFFVINEKGYEKKVSGQLKNMNDLKGIFNSEEKIKKLSKKFGKLIKLMKDICGRDSFQTLSKDNKRNWELSDDDWKYHQFTGKINQGLFHLLSYYLPQYDDNQINRKKPKKIRSGLLKLLKNKKFTNKITGGSTDKTSNIKISKEVLGKNFLLPCMGDPTLKSKRNISKEFKRTLLGNIPYCYLCYGNLTKVEFVEDFKEIPAEHIRSYKSGAKDNFTNILLAHRRCNSEKGGNKVEKYRNSNTSIEKRERNKNNIKEYLSSLKEWNKRYPLNYYKKLVQFARDDKKL